MLITSGSGRTQLELQYNAQQDKSSESGGFTKYVFWNYRTLIHTYFMNLQSSLAVWVLAMPGLITLWTKQIRLALSNINTDTITKRVRPSIQSILLLTVRCSEEES